MMLPIPGLQPDGTIDPVQLRALLRGVIKIDEKIDEFAKSGKTPDYVVDSVRGLRDAIYRWADEREGIVPAAPAAELVDDRAPGFSDAALAPRLAKADPRAGSMAHAGTPDYLR